MNIYSRRMAFTFISLGLIWVSPFIYLSVSQFLPETFTTLVNKNEPILFGIYITLVGGIYLFGKAWAYWGQQSQLKPITKEQ